MIDAGTKSDRRTPSCNGKETPLCRRHRPLYDVTAEADENYLAGQRLPDLHRARTRKNP